MDKEDLAHRVNPDPALLGELMDRYGQDVWNYAYFLVKHRAMADDIAQDTFIQAYRHFYGFRQEASLKTWLLRIARNVSFNYRNAAFFRKVLLMDIVSPRQPGRSAEQDYLAREAASEIWRYVLDLPVKLRETLVLHAKYELSVAEIADLQRIPEGTVKSRLFAARRRIAFLLKEDEEDERA
ncbi:sigma-70 family RNA polymerase sigma factor [Cohnella hashimotonis]|uniref:RNA polymerase sigma factor n=1 Tax=Cohnella hashimotonis TaxID=2826895 RepID=A0ABT6TD38_9BACL|nr:sigma-70 family RNA polymerase sigma factor [Cohnella hashimotonis]